MSHHQQGGEHREDQPVSFMRKWALPLATGQLVSLLLTGCGASSQALAGNYDVDVPTTQSFVNYLLLAVFFVPVLVRGGRFRQTMRTKWWKYLLLAVADVEANFLLIRAYQFTSITSVMLLDCFTIPVVMVLSWVFLRTRYRWTHLVAVLMCVAGLAMLLLADVDAGDSSNALWGDALVLMGACLYAVSNVCQEAVVKTIDVSEFLGMVGFFGTFVNGAQAAVLEHKNLLAMEWSRPVVLLMAAFGICLFLMYVITSFLIQRTGAAFFNLSLLTSDIFGLLVGVLLFNTKLSAIYFGAYFTIIIGIVVFNLRDAESRLDPLPATAQEYNRLTDDVLSPPAPPSPTPAKASTLGSSLRVNTRNPTGADGSGSSPGNSPRVAGSKMAPV